MLHSGSRSLAALAGIVMFAGSLTQAFAQQLAEIGALVREERPAEMSEPIYRRLEAVHELYAEGETDQVLQRLVNLQAQRLTTYESALVEQMFGYCYMQRGEVDLAIEAFARSVDLDGLQNIPQQELRYSLASLYASEGQFEDAVDTMLTWFAYASEPVAADGFMLVGSSYAQQAEFSAALPYVEEAITRATETNEPWYTLELSIHFELMDFAGAVSHLQEMVLLWPGNALYWDLLAGTYLELQDDASALATLMVAYENGLVFEEAKLLNLIRLNLFLDVPYQAAVILEAELSVGRIAESQETLDLLLSAWTRAHEFDRALSVIDRLAPLSGDASYLVRKARLLSEQARWDEAIEAAEAALVAGGLEDTGETLLLKGIAQAELGRYDDALATLQEASGLESEAATSAAAWSDYVRDRQQALASQR